MPPPTTAQQSKNPFTTIILTGLTAGALDITGACTQYYIKTGKEPGNVLRFVASGVFDKEAFTGGTTMAAWGLFFHFVNAFAFTLFFFWLYPKIKILAKNKLITGLVYGLFAWTVMNLIVVPLSSVPSKSKLWAMAAGSDGKNRPVLQLPADPTQMIIGIVIILFCIGLPISLIISRYYTRRQVL